MGGLQAAWKVDCARAEVAVRCSGEALSLPKPFWGGSQPPRSVVQRLRGRLIGLRMLLKRFYVPGWGDRSVGRGE